MTAKTRIVLALIVALVWFEAGHAQQSAEEPADGYFFRHVVTDALEKKYGLRIGGYFQSGFAFNDRSDNDTRHEGLTNAPLVLNRDWGFQLNQLSIYADRDPKANIVPRVGPFPGPVPQEFDWGFNVNAIYGRDGQPLQTFGWDDKWDINKPGNRDPARAAENRQNFFIQPQLIGKLYLPFWNGIALYAGNFQSPVGLEIGYPVRPTPNYFYSHSYAFASAPIKHTGVLGSVNLMRSEGLGLLAGEVGVVQGWSNFRDNNDAKSVLGALRWRSPDLRTWIDFEFITGDEENATSKVARHPNDFPQAPVSRIISPDGQNKTFLSLNGSHEFANRKWRVAAEVIYGHQEGDGKAETIDIVTGPGFDGATWVGGQAMLIYQLRPDLSFGTRFEHFQDRDGFALLPNTTVRSDFNALTLGATYFLSKFVVFRPEVRYDWQTGRANGTADNAFCGGTTNCKSNQFTFSIDMVLYF